ncbi:phosphatase PAP2 family protein [Actinophytocola sp.]|uniref:phosphatase PAP2 family protein n=1 Tax=Actinophytocola sp. TaxID=1872138 RepID=UPI002EDA05A0
MSLPLPTLPPALRRPLAVLAVLAAVVVVALGVRFAGESSAGPLDAKLLPWLESSTSAYRPLALTIDFAGEPVGLASLVVLLTAVSLLLRRPRMAVLVVLGTGLTITATTAIKPFVNRHIHGDFLSYPSGHTASATALAMIAVMLAWHRLRPVAAFALMLAVALVVGAAAAWAQAGLVAHYPTDTVGGWCTALAVVPATAWLIDRAAAWRTSRRTVPAA